MSDYSPTTKNDINLMLSKLKLKNLSELLLNDLKSGSLIEKKTFLNFFLTIRLTQGGVFP